MYSFGWIRDYPDFRDYSEKESPVRQSAEKKIKPKSTDKVDLRKYCSPIEDQEKLGSCTANAAAGLIEYFEMKSFGNYLDASRLFIYKNTRNLMKLTGDTGGTLRMAMKSLAHFGVCPEEFHPYEISNFDKEIPAFLYAYGQNFKGQEYYRVDTSDKTPQNVLDAIKKNLSNNLPMIFGFTVYSSIQESAKNGGKILFPERGEKVMGGHAIMAVGYDDNLKIGKYQGALLIRNSWGTNWGESGYGWLPYEYVLKGLAVDFWTLIKAEYIDGALFE